MLRVPVRTRAVKKTLPDRATPSERAPEQGEGNTLVLFPPTLQPLAGAPHTPQVANTRPTGRIWPSTLFYQAQHLVSTQKQGRALA